MAPPTSQSTNRTEPNQTEPNQTEVALENLSPTFAERLAGWPAIRNTHKEIQVPMGFLQLSSSFGGFVLFYFCFLNSGAIISVVPAAWRVAPEVGAIEVGGRQRHLSFFFTLVQL